MSRKLRVKDIKKDEVGNAFAAFASRGVRLYQSHRKPLIVIGGIVVVGALALGIGAWTLRSREQDAAASFSQAIRDMEQLESPQPPGEAPPKTTWDDVIATLRGLANDQPHAAAGILASFQVGIAELRAGRSADAATSISAFVDKHPEHWATPHALAALAAAREAAGDADGARAALEKLRDGDWHSYPAGAALMLLGEYYERHSMVDEARSAYTKVSEDPALATSPYASQAKARLQALGGQPATQAKS